MSRVYNMLDIFHSIFPQTSKKADIFLFVEPGTSAAKTVRQIRCCSVKHYSRTVQDAAAAAGAIYIYIYIYDDYAYGSKSKIVLLRSR